MSPEKGVSPSLGEDYAMFQREHDAAGPYRKLIKEIPDLKKLVYHPRQIDVNDGGLTLIVENRFVAGQVGKYLPKIRKYMSSELGIANPRVDIIVDKKHYDSLVRLPKGMTPRPAQLEMPVAEGNSRLKVRPAISEEERDRAYADILYPNPNIILYPGNKYAFGVMKDLKKQRLVLDKGGTLEGSGAGICLIGPHGVGKTTLANWLMSEVLKEKVLTGYLDIESLVESYKFYEKNRTDPDLRHLHRPKVIVFDGLERLVRNGRPIGKGHTINLVSGLLNTKMMRRENQVICCYAGDVSSFFPEFVDVIKKKNDSLAARLSELRQVPVHPPSEEQRKQVIGELLGCTGIKIQEGELEPLVDYINLTFLDNEPIGRFRGLVESVAEYAGDNQGYINSKIVEEFLGAESLLRRVVPLPERIIGEVAAEFAEFGVTTDKIKAKPRGSKEVALARKVAAYLIWRETSEHLATTARRLGRADHTSTIYSRNKVKRMLDPNDELYVPGLQGQIETIIGKVKRGKKEE